MPGDVNVSGVLITTTTPSKYIIEDGKYKLVVDTENITVVETPYTRELTAKELVDCQPVVPEPVVVPGEWVAGKFECGDTIVTWTRVITTTISTPVFKDGKWVIEKNDVISAETKDVPLTDEQLESCAVPPVTPPVTPPTPPVTPPTTPLPPVNPAPPIVTVGTTPKPVTPIVPTHKVATKVDSSESLAYTGSDNAGSIALAALFLLGTGLAVKAFSRRRKGANN